MNVDDQPTCGKGLADYSVLPETLGKLTAAAAEILEVHMKALDRTDKNAQAEYAAYLNLVKEHRAIATQLLATAQRMSGHRDLPMGRHDVKAMSSPRALEVFERFVKLEDELVTLLRNRLEQDRKMLVEMRSGTPR
jgi:hypothetical protein